MRPRKLILLFCTDECHRSWVKFFLENTGRFRVMGCISSEPPIPDAILVVDDRSLGTVTTVRGIGDLLPNVPLFIIPARNHGGLAHGYPAWAFPLPPNPKPAVIIERLTIATKAKKGPKGPRSVTAQIEATA